MSRSSLRKVVAAGLGAALIGSGLTVGLGAGVASAVSECNSSASVTSEKGTAKYRIQQKIIGNGIAAPGGTVTYQTTISTKSGIPALISSIGQFHPEGFAPISARINVWKAVGGQAWSDTTPIEDHDQNLTQANGAGWNVAGQTATFEVTYKVPDSATPGDELRSGMAFGRLSITGAETFPDAGACLKIRSQSAVEAGAGSLDAIGLGSVNAGLGNMFGSAVDPAGSVANIVEGIDFGKVLQSAS